MEYVFLPPKEIVVVNIILLDIGGDLIHSVLVVACLQSSVFFEFCLCVPNPSLSQTLLSQFSEVCVEAMPFYPFPGYFASYTHSGC